MPPKGNKPNNKNKQSLHSQIKTIKSPLWTCKHCEEEVLDDPEEEEEESIECTKCKGFYHWLNCTELKKKEYNFLRQAGASCVYICESCMHESSSPQSASNRNLNQFDEIKRMMMSLQESIKAVDAKVEKGVTMQMVEDKIDEKIAKRFDDLKKQMEDQSQVDVQKEVEVRSKEKEEQERRKENLLIVNIPESDQPEAADRVAHDLKTVTEIIHRIAPGVKEEEILNPIRLGKKEKNAKYHRLIRITIKSTESRNQITTNKFKINKDETSPKDRIYINRDLTESQRVREKTQRKEMYDMRRDNPGKTYQWKYGKIVETTPKEDQKD